MKKVKCRWIVLLTLIFMSILVACETSAPTPTPSPEPTPTVESYTVFYAVDDASRGSIACVNSNGTSVESGAEHEEGASLTLSATANDGYAFDGWYVNGQRESANASYTFTVSKDVSYTAKFSVNSYALTYTSEDTVKGTVTENNGVASGAQVAYKAQVVLVASANTGYTFDGWYVGAERVSTASTFTFEMPASAYNVQAKFSVTSYTFTYSTESAQKGSVVESNAVTSGSSVAYNTSLVLVAYPNTGYVFDGWYVNGVKEETDTPWTFTMPASAYTVEARFVEDEYTLTFSSQDTDKGTVAGADGVESGAEIAYNASFELTATAKTGYVFDGWYVNGVRVSSSSTHEFTMPASAYTVEARFVEDEYTLTFISEDTIKGTVAESNGITSGSLVVYKTQVVLVATEKTGYDFDGWYVDGESVSTNSTYSFTMPAGAYTVEARFKAEKRTVSFYDGYIKVHEETVDYNTPVAEYTYTKDNYNFMGWFKEANFATVYNFEQGVTTNINLYAKTERTIVTYEVVFVKEDGTACAGVQTVEEGYTVPHVPQAPAKDGYNFTGWVVYDATLEKDVPFDASKPIESDLTIKPTYSIQTFTVRCYLDDAMTELYGSQTVEYKKSAVKPETPTDEEKLFVKWVYADDTTVEFDFSTQITANETIIAVWMPKPAETYTVTFYDGEGGRLLDTQYVVEGGSATAPANPEKEGYTFIGWDKEFDSVTGSISVYAEFEIKTFTVVFKNDDGTVLKAEQTVEYGSSALAPTNPEKAGHTFVGWDKAFDEVKEDVVIVAKYEIHKFTVTYIDAETTEIIFVVENVAYDSLLAVPTTPSKAGYSFIGWYTDEACDTEYNFNTPVTDNVDIYAKFEIIEIAKYTVTFVDMEGNTISVQTVVEGNSAIEPNAPAKEGYIFVEWDSTFDEITSDLTVTAIYDAKRYTVTFWNIDGTVELAQIQVAYNNSALLNAPTAPTIAGKEFSGWSKDISNITKNIEVWAVYTTETRVVHFDDGSGTVSSVNVEYGSYVNIPSTPSKAGYIFEYWYLDDEKVPFNFATAITEEITLTAKYRHLTNMYTVTFYAPDDSVYGNVQVVANGKTAIEPAPYFDGTTTDYIWCLANGDEFDFATLITCDVQLYAKAVVNN